jgi:voltage-gated sodium channel
MAYYQDAQRDPVEAKASRQTWRSCVGIGDGQPVQSSSLATQRLEQGMFTMRELEAYVKDLHWVAEKNMLITEKSMAMIDELHQDHVATTVEKQCMPVLQKEHSFTSSFEKEPVRQVIRSCVAEVLQSSKVVENKDTALQRERTIASDLALSQMIRTSVMEAMQSMETRAAKIQLQQAPKTPRKEEEWVQLATLGEQMHQAFKESTQNCQRVLEEHSKRLQAQEVQHLQSLDPVTNKVDKLTKKVDKLSSSVSQALAVTPRKDNDAPHLGISTISLDHTVRELKDLVSSLREPVEVVTTASVKEEFVVEADDQVAEKCEEKDQQADLAVDDTFDMEHILTEAETEKPNVVEKIVSSTAFEMTFALLIVLNTVKMCLEAEIRGWETGHNIGIPGGEVVSSGANTALEVVEMFFSILFTGEIALKFVALRWAFWKSAWNLFDLFIIGISWITKILQFDLPINPMLLRLVRLVRLLRLVRSLSAFEVFDNLNLMVKGIKSGLPVIIWVMVLVFPVLSCCGLGMNYMLVDFMLDEENEMAHRKSCYAYFGTFTKSLLTMFEVTFGSWVPVTRFLFSNVDERFAIFFMLYRLIIGIGVLRVIYGVFLHVTFECATNDEDIVLAQKTREDKRFDQRMRALFHKFDVSGDGVLTRSEFSAILHNPRVKTLLSAMELDIDNPDLVFDLADDGDGQMNAEEMANSFGKLKGSARSMDIWELINLSRKNSAKFDQLLGIENAHKHSKKTA